MVKKVVIEDAIMFIDTNIFLDFYRYRKTDSSIESLEKIQAVAGKLILTSQVEMEYQKNRQKVILETYKQRKAENDNSQTPEIISSIKAIDMINSLKKEMKKQELKVKEKLEKILINPASNDDVYKYFKRIYKLASEEFKLTTESEKWSEINGKALDRFQMGYPPRKKDDTSYGDAINWEWVIHCALVSGKNIIIVTRDSDYGVMHNGNIYLNDWLKAEFKSRLSQKRKIEVTSSLSKALKMLNVSVSQEAQDTEDELIEGLRDSINGSSSLDS
ncbi:PIN domain-containing protein [Petrocella sp. FN5]|uniref:PIN domain-containing protein n=1 Tax=Petrocella sp. FN5 TaxID=3032002 RepID=UPI0023DCE579|nr:PIN domain-containing protein [Petrocella sp. FN5]MDF1617989.1 PIN domain-containing protein [Petrocella sp. FN5]